MLSITGNHALLQEQLQRAADTGGVDETAARALEKLDDFHHQNIGSSRSNATGPLRATERAIEDASRTLNAARERHAHYVEVAAAEEVAATAAEAADRMLKL